ncbi:unnamed protein product, partial [Urochloa humidicola]
PHLSSVSAKSDPNRWIARPGRACAAGAPPPLAFTAVRALPLCFAAVPLHRRPQASPRAPAPSSSGPIDEHQAAVPSAAGNTSSCLVTMDPKHSAEVSKHLDKQNQALMETYRAMSHELHKLQVEEETIMRKLYELMSAEGLLPKRKKEKQQEEKGAASTPENKEWEP